MKNLVFLPFTAVVCCVIFGFSNLTIDQELYSVIEAYQLDSYAEKPTFNAAKVELGRMLFFDKLLSGNKDISCATCHHPSLASADALPLSIGVGGKGLGQNRQMGTDADLERIPRNSPDIFNRGSADWHTMFWDNRVSGSVEEGFTSPADEDLPEGLESVLAVQAMFPVLSRDEMRGEIGDKDVNGEPNELALIGNPQEAVIWHRLMLRIMEYPEYRKLFKAAYPALKERELGFQHAANAIAAFETEAFTFNDSPWDDYLAGAVDALNESAKRGALLFYGKANCASCHSGNLMTDQEAHNIGVPQLGPGKGEARPIDPGQYLETGKQEHLFAFRTPALKNTAITGPWMHNGAFSSLEETILHHIYPEVYLENYADNNQIPAELKATIRTDETLNKRLLENLDPGLETISELRYKEVQDLVVFLESLTDKSALCLEDLIPTSVPSGLPVAD